MKGCYLLPSNYLSSCDGHNWAQILQALVRKISPDVLAMGKRQAVDIVARGRGNGDDLIRQKYESLQTHVEHLWKEVRKIQAECTELETSIDVEAERKAKDRLLTTFSSHVQFKDKSKEHNITASVAREDGIEMDAGAPLETDAERVKTLFVLHTAVVTSVDEISENVGGSSSDGGPSCMGRKVKLRLGGGAS